MWIIALDGSKGAGKTTLVSTFLKKAPDTVAISLDKERVALGIIGTSFEKNKVAFKQVEKKVSEALEAGHNVILDCGLYDTRIDFLEETAEKYKAKLHLVFLKASYDVLVKRVAERDNSKGRIFNKERFDEVYKVVNDKNFSKFTVLNSDESSPVELAQALIEASQA